METSRGLENWSEKKMWLKSPKKNRDRNKFPM